MDTSIQRHKTAIRRPGLSLPVQCLLRDGLLDEKTPLFDYGCGRGQDVEMLAEMGIPCGGWDPAYRPDAPIARSKVVNLGYVINVIENQNERVDVLKKAWDLCDDLLVVSAISPSDRDEIAGREQYGDGVLSSRGTFQKFFSHMELRGYLQEILPADAIAAAPNIFYLFKNQEAQQQVLANRYTRRAAIPRVRISEKLFEENKTILEPLMAVMAQLGRLPGPDEFPAHDTVVAAVGSVKRALQIVARATGQQPWQEIAVRRREDVLVTLALSRFGVRKPLSRLPLSLQRDIKAFCSNFTSAMEEANRLLFSVGNAEAIDAACLAVADKQGTREGVQKEGGTEIDSPILVENALIVPKSYLPELPPILRVYEGCARALLGEVEDAELVKLHRFSGKVTYLVGVTGTRDEVSGQAIRVAGRLTGGEKEELEVGPSGDTLILPCRRRIKVNLRTLEIQEFVERRE